MRESIRNIESLGRFALDHRMKIKMAIKLTVFGGLIVAIGYWLRGHDILTGLALLLLFGIVVAKVVAALIVRRGGGPPPGDGGSESAGRPVPRPTGDGPAVLSAAAEVRHEPAT